MAELTQTQASENILILFLYYYIAFMLYPCKSVKRTELGQNEVGKINWAIQYQI